MSALSHYVDRPDDRLARRRGLHQLRNRRIGLRRQRHLELRGDGRTNLCHPHQAKVPCVRDVRPLHHQRGVQITAGRPESVSTLRRGAFTGTSVPIREASFRPPGRATIAGLRLDATAPLGALRFSLPFALSRRGPVAQFHQQFAEDSIVHRLDKVHIETRTLGATTIRVLAPAGQGH